MNESIQVLCIAMSCVAIVVSLGTAIAIGLLFQSNRLKGMDGRHGCNGQIGLPGRDGVQTVVFADEAKPVPHYRSVVHFRMWDGTIIEVLGRPVYTDSEGNEILEPVGE